LRADRILRGVKFKHFLVPSMRISRVISRQIFRLS
jgi:hypothetical protein